MEGVIRRARFARTLPGPTSSARVTPASASSCIVCSQRTTPSICRTSKSGTRAGSALGRASTLLTTGKASGRTVIVSSRARTASAAGRISAE